MARANEQGFYCLAAPLFLAACSVLDMSCSRDESRKPPSSTDQPAQTSSELNASANDLPGDSAPAPGPGEKLFGTKGCVSCHTVDDSWAATGPDLKGVGQKYVKLKGSEEKAREWFSSHLRDPEKFPGDLKAKYRHVNMPRYELTEEEIGEIVDYLMGL